MNQCKTSACNEISATTRAGLACPDRRITLLGSNLRYETENNVARHQRRIAIIRTVKLTISDLGNSL